MKYGGNKEAFKFGGSTFPKDALYDGFAQAANYLLDKQNDGYKPIAVVSAPHGMSDIVIHATKFLDDKYASEIPIVADAAQRSSGDTALFAKILTDSIGDVYTPHISKLDPAYAGKLTMELGTELERLRKSLAEGGDRDELSALPENHSGIWLSNVLKNLGADSFYLDGMQAGVIVDHNGIVMRHASSNAIRYGINGMLENGSIPVIGGYIGRDGYTGKPRLNGRNGTDKTAAIVAKALNAEKLFIVKDVDGVHNAPPKIETRYGDIKLNTRVVPKLSYDEALVDSSGVAHAEAIEIARDDDAYAFGDGAKMMPIVVMSLNGGEKKGTTVEENGGTNEKHPVAMISTMPIYLLKVADSQMMGQAGYGYRVLQALDRTQTPFLDSVTPGADMKYAIPQKFNKTKVDIDGVRKGVQEDIWSQYPNCHVDIEEFGLITLIGDSIMKSSTSKIERALKKNGVTVEPQTRSGNVINMFISDLKDHYPMALELLMKELY